MISLSLRFRSLLGVLVAVVTSCGCLSTLKEEYYLKAYDPDQQVSNYFRIRVSGSIWLSTAKYSVGFYDRTAVETLFGEKSLRQEYLIAQTNVLDAATRDQLAELNDKLAAAQSSLDRVRREQLLRALGVAAGVLERFRVRLASGAISEPGVYDASLGKAGAAVEAARAALDTKALDIAVAMEELETAQVILEAIRIALDGKSLVRFFDGAGNELPVRDKTLVIFVATDVSRFAQALGQLAEASEAKQELLLAILGPRLQEAELLANRVKASDAEATAAHDQLDALVKEAEGEDAAALMDTIAKAAAVAGGREGRFTTAEEIRGYASGLEPPR